MTVGPITVRRNDPMAWRTAAIGLLLAAAIVGIAIVVGGPPARVLNGIGAVLWIASGVFLIRSLPLAQRPALGWVAAIGSGLVLGAIVRPGDLGEVIVWFAIAGAIVVVAAGDRNGGWALLAPAIYLPVHLMIGIGRALVRDGGVRTDPPPTAAIVPLVMVLAAVAAGVLAAAFLRNRYSDAIAPR